MEDTHGSLFVSPPLYDYHGLSPGPPQYCHEGCPAHPVSRADHSREFCYSHGVPERPGHIVKREKFGIQI